MKKIMPALGVLFVAQFVFVGLVHALLKVQGKDTPETYATLHDMPVLGGFFAAAAPEPEVDPEAEREARALAQLLETRDFFPLPEGFSRSEAEELFRLAKEARDRYTQELLALETEREEVSQIRSEVETERQGLLAAGEALKKRAEELQSGMEELELKANRIAADEVKNLRTVAGIYEQMSPEGAAKALRDLGEDTAARILNQIPARRSARILGAMDTNTAVAITRRIQALTLTSADGDSDTTERAPGGAPSGR